MKKPFGGSKIWDTKDLKGLKKKSGNTSLR